MHRDLLICRRIYFLKMQKGLYDENQIPFYNGGSVLLDDLNHFVGEPLAHMERHHDFLVPPEFLFAVFGRKPMQKARAIEQYCLNSGHFAHVQRIKVEFSRTTLAVDAIQTYMGQPAEKHRALILEGAEQLILHPDNELTRQYILDLREDAYKNGVLVFACFDRDPMTRTHQQLPESISIYRNKAMRQFRLVLFVPQPGSDYRRHCIETLLQKAQDHFAKCGRSIQVNLSDQDYANLDTYTSGCGPLDLCEFIQRVLRDVAFDGGEANPFKGQESPSVITLDILRRYMTETAGRGLHVLAYDPRFEESNLMSTCKKGCLASDVPVPPAKAKKQAAALMKKEKKSVLKRGRVKLEEEEAEEEDGEKRVKLEKEVEDAFAGVKVEEEKEES